MIWGCKTVITLWDKGFQRIGQRGEGGFFLEERKKSKKTLRYVDNMYLLWYTPFVSCDN